MGQVLRPDVLNNPTVNSTTVVELPSDNIITIGGQQYTLTNKLMTATTVGAGGLDAGALGASLTYNLFAVSDSGLQNLVGSLAAAPAGFPAYELVGTFETNSLSQIIVAYGLNPNLRSVRFSTSGTFIAPQGVTRVFLSGKGGAGGGGGGSDNFAGASASGGGGGQGIISERISAEVIPGSSYLVVIGAGGTGGNGTNISSTASGGAGGTGGVSSFGTITFRNVGDGGTGATNAAGGPGGTGGAFNSGNDGGTGGTVANDGNPGSGNLFFTAGAAGDINVGNNGGGGGGGAGEIAYVAPNGKGSKGQNLASAVAATGAVRVSNIVTVTTTGVHGFVVGQRVHVSAMTDTSFNSVSFTLVSGGFVILSTPSTTIFTYAQTAADATSGSGNYSGNNGFDGENGFGGGGGGGAQNTGHRGGCGGIGSNGQIIVSW